MRSIIQYSTQAWKMEDRESNEVRGVGPSHSDGSQDASSAAQYSGREDVKGNAQKRARDGQKWERGPAHVATRETDCPSATNLPIRRLHEKMIQK